ncbi:MAG: ATP-dependent Clp protease ATP-binding subunit [Bacteroidales bacterium]|nr:ATP-dependent Clp protease ATP-binding subunit [Bacteroidales bacterium]
MRSKYTQRFTDVIAYSKEESERLQNNYVGPEHLMLGIIREGNGIAIELLEAFDVDVEKLKENIDSAVRLAKKEVIDGAERQGVLVTKNTDKILRMSFLEAKAFNTNDVDTQHLLLAILKNGENLPARLLQEENVTYDELFSFLEENIENFQNHDAETMGADFTDNDDDDDEEMEDLSSFRESSKTSQSPGNAKGNSDTPVLNNFGTDITLAAAENRLDPIVGREKEIERIAQILSRRKKNNPILIGEPGVGKSAIVEGLALRIIQKKVSRVLFDKRIISLDLPSIVAGTKYRGQFEERIRAILNELSKNPDVILFIDEIHTLVGAGNASGSLDAANILKPALARGEIQCIGATTLDEYRNNIEKDGALERRFQKVMVDPSSAEETLQILKNIKDRYEEHHNVNYTEEALEACVKLTDRYISDRNFPDKAIDALDEAGSRVHISNIVIPKSIEDLEHLIEEIKAEKIQAVKSQNFELAAGFRDKERELLQRLEEAKTKWEKEMQENRQTVDTEKVAEVVAMMSGVPVQRIAQAENQRLLEMKSMLTSKVIGQDEAVNKIVKAIQRSRVGLKDPNHPIGTFMFLGPTGVGKTHLAKMLAEFLFDSPEALIRIDMSEYMEKFTVSRLIGAPPGYVGYEEGGQLTEKVRRKPYSVILLDEIEKAHPDVFNLLLQVLDEGRLTDSLGRRVDFKNTILIMTSNIGTRQLKDFGKGVGFNVEQTSEKEHSRSVIQKALNRAFAPEFLNRIDDIIMFDQLDKDAIYKIIDLELKGFYQRLEQLGYKLQLTDKAKEFIASKGYDVQFGARPLKRAIQKYLEDELAEMIIQTTIVEGDTVKVDFDEKEQKITTQIVSHKV